MQKQFQMHASNSAASNRARMRFVAHTSQLVHACRTNRSHPGGLYTLQTLPVTQKLGHELIATWFQDAHAFSNAQALHWLDNRIPSLGS